MENKLKSSAQRIQDALHEHNLGLKVIEIKELTRASQDAAEAVWMSSSSNKHLTNLTSKKVISVN